jgi:hypothetical protein
MFFCPWLCNIDHPNDDISFPVHYMLIIIFIFIFIFENYGPPLQSTGTCHQWTVELSDAGKEKVLDIKNSLQDYILTTNEVRALNYMNCARALVLRKAVGPLLSSLAIRKLSSPS